MRKELVVCLLVAVSFCLTASAQAQLFRRWRAPQAQTSCPQSRPQVNQSVAWVVVNQQGRVLRQLSSDEVAQFLSQQQAVKQQTRNTKQVAASPSAGSPKPEAVLPGAQTSQPAVTGHAPTPQDGAQVDIARQTAVATPILAGPTTTPTTQPVAASVVAQPTTVEAVALIEPATETPAGTMKVDNLVLDQNVVPATSNEAISILESSQDGVSILDSQADPGSGATLLLSGPEDN